MGAFEDRHAARILGTISCFDRVVITGMIPDIGHAKAAARHLRENNVRLFDYPKWAEPFRHEIRENAERIAQENGVEIEYLRRKGIRKETLIKKILAERGDHPGLVHIFSVMEGCPSFRAWHDKRSGSTSLRHRDAQCLHYYFYFIHEELGLCYLRVPTWAPFRLQFYFNGHNQLASQLGKADIGYTLRDNAFISIDDFDLAQRLADQLNVRRLHRLLDQLARTYCPVIQHFGSGYHWSLMQVEYSTDVVFRKQSEFQPLYHEITRTAIHAVKPENVATFLGRKLSGNYQDELGNDFQTRIHGTRIKHHMGYASIKLYDKFGVLARVECTANNVTFFKHHRWVEHRDGTKDFKLAPVRKTIYSLPDLMKLLRAANRRYLDFIADIEDPSSGVGSLDKISRPARDADRSYRGFNLFLAEDIAVFEAIVRGEFTISGFANKTLRALLPHVSASKMCRILKRLRLHGLIKKIGHRYKYYLTALGRRAVNAALAVRELILIPILNASA